MEHQLGALLLENHFPQKKMAFVVGPRQVGKTYLANHLLQTRNSSDLYRNWDDLEWRRELSNSPYGFVDQYRPIQSFLKPLVVLDEIHKFPRWKRYVKGLWDTRQEKIDLLVTGSGRLDIYQKGGDSLFGRYHQYRLHPFSLNEILLKKLPGLDRKADDTLQLFLETRGKPTREIQDAYQNLFKWGGFPEPFLAQSENRSRLWQKERRDLVIKQDLRDLSRIQLLSHVEQLVELLVPRAASLLSIHSLHEDLQAAYASVRQWVDYLCRLYFIYLIRPYAKRIQRAIRKEAKVFLWDWSEIKEEGNKFENLLASHLLKWCHFSQDWGLESLEVFFVRDKEKREVDFLLTKESKPWLLIESKLNDRTPSAALHLFAKQLGVQHKLLVVHQLKQTGRANDVIVVDAPTFLSSLPV